jgi:sugar O-acyltransferase (sialic acid O-acetyltransferase NeuD family)
MRDLGVRPRFQPQSVACKVTVMVGQRTIAVVGVASPYAWDVVDSALRSGFDITCVDNLGGADPRLPGLMRLEDFASPAAAFAIGLSGALNRARVLLELAERGFTNPVAMIDRSSVIGSGVEIGHCVYVNAGVVVGPNTRIGCAVNINRSASIGHEGDLGYAVNVSPNATLTYGVVVEPLAWIGAGATILPGLRIGRGAVVGGGSVVTEDVEAGTVVAGNPARPLRSVEVPGGEFTCPYCSMR